MSSHSPEPEDLRRPHPLAMELIERLRPGSGARVLELGSGHGRNTRALAAAGFAVEAIADDRLTPALELSGDAFDAALSTHGFLHGTRGSIGTLVAAVARKLKSGAPVYATFGSVRDTRFGLGERIEDSAFAPDAGEERGVTHAYYDQAALGVLLQPLFEIERLEEHDADRIVGRWAHAQAPQGAVHWFVRMRRRSAQ